MNIFHDGDILKSSTIEKTADYIVGLFVGNLPPIQIFNSFKSLLMRLRGAKIGKRVKYYPGLWIDRYSKITIGSDVSLAKDIIFVATGGINIGDRTMIGYGTTILTANHIIPSNRGQMRFSGFDYKQVKIENDVWIGARVIILPGITIGEGSIVGAGSVVTKNTIPFSVNAGVPAKLIRMRL